MPRFAYSWWHRLLILVYLAETEIYFKKDDRKIKSQKNIDRHDPITYDERRPPLRPPLDLITDYL